MYKRQEQGGAIIDLGGQLGWRLLRLRLRNGGKPVAEGLAVLRGVETEKVGSSVAVAVAGVEDEGNRNAQAAMAPQQVQLKMAGSYWGLQKTVEDSAAGRIFGFN